MKIPFSSLKDWKIVYQSLATCESESDDGSLFDISMKIVEPAPGKCWVLQMSPLIPMPERGRLDRDVILGEYEEIESLERAIMKTVRLASLERGTVEPQKHIVYLETTSALAGVVEALSPWEAESMLMFDIEYADGAMSKDLDVDEFIYHWNGMSASIHESGEGE